MNGGDYDRRAIALGAVAVVLAAPPLIAVAVAAGADLLGIYLFAAVGCSAVGGAVAAAGSTTTDREYFDGALGAVWGLFLLTTLSPFAAAVLWEALAWPLAGFVFLVGGPMALFAPFAWVVGRASARFRHRAGGTAVAR